jgi:hypothetical protein
MTKKTPKEEKRPERKWPVTSLTKTLIREARKRGLTPAQIGHVIAAPEDGHVRNANTESQSYREVVSGDKRLWIGDAEEWAKLLHGRLRLTFEDAWADLEAAIDALPNEHDNLRKHLRALIQSEVEDQISPKRRAV